jgi:hypothetical protein
MFDIDKYYQEYDHKNAKHERKNNLQREKSISKFFIRSSKPVKYSSRYRCDQNTKCNKKLNINKLKDTKLSQYNKLCVGISQFYNNKQNTSYNNTHASSKSGDFVMRALTLDYIFKITKIIQSKKLTGHSHLDIAIIYRIRGLLKEYSSKNITYECSLTNRIIYLYKNAVYYGDIHSIMYIGNINFCMQKYSIANAQYYMAISAAKDKIKYLHTILTATDDQINDLKCVISLSYRMLHIICTHGSDYLVTQSCLQNKTVASTNEMFNNSITSRQSLDILTKFAQKYPLLLVLVMMKKLCNTQLQDYNLLTKLGNYEHINKIKMRFETKYHIHCFKNKCNLLSKIGECPICFNSDVKMIPTECAHYYCIECYVTLNARCCLCNRKK